jgi:DNA-binding LacI/PurR family transcriptional regulator
VNTAEWRGDVTLIHFFPRPAPTAAFCSGDLLAIGLMERLRAHGLKLPEDFAVVGFDDINSAHVIHPPLTTVHVDKEAMGRLAVRKFFEILKQPDMEPEKIVVLTDFLIRGTCGRRIQEFEHMNGKKIEGGDNRSEIAIETGS